MRYAFFYEIPSTWTSDDYPRPADLADGEDHTMRFSFFMEHGGRSWDTQFNDYHGEYTMVVEDPEPAAGDEDDDDADDDEEDEDEKYSEPVPEMIERVPLAKVQNGFKELRLLL